MALDDISALQGGTCAIKQTELCLYLMSLRMCHLFLNHEWMSWVIWPTFPQPRGLNKSVAWVLELLMTKTVTYFENHYFNLCLLMHMPILLLWYLPPRQPDGRQMSCLYASGTLCPPLRARCRGWGYLRLPGVRCWRRSARRCASGSGWPESWILEIWGSSPPPHPWRVPSPTFPTAGAGFKDATLRERCVAESIWTVYMTEPRYGLH